MINKQLLNFTIFFLTTIAGANSGLEKENLTFVVGEAARNETGGSSALIVERIRAKTIVRGSLFVAARRGALLLTA